MPSSSTQVLIIGAGPTGLFLAAELRRYGVEHRIIDRRQRPTTESRATDLQPRSLEVLERVGALARVEQRGYPIHAINIHVADGGRTPRRLARMEFAELETPFPHMLASAQRNTERGLMEHYDGLGGVVERGVELQSIDQGGRVSCTLVDHRGVAESVDCAYVVGCDGAHSSTRKLLGIPFPGESYPEHHFLADARVRWDIAKDELHGFITQGGSLMVLALPGPDEYRLFFDVEPSDPREPTLEVLRQLLAERSPIPATLDSIGWATRFRQHRRLVPRYREGRGFLAGDAAHIHSIIPGQGLNLGIQDAYNLGWKLAQVCTGVASEALLESYDAERRPLAALTLRSTHVFYRTFVLRGHIARAARDLLMPRMMSIPAVHDRTAELCSELSHHYRTSPIVHTSRARQGLKPGDRAPDVSFVDRAGVEARLFTHLASDAYSLLLFAGDGSARRAELSAVTRALAGRFGAAVRSTIVITAGDTMDLEEALWIDDHAGSIHRRYNASSGRLCLIRPDGYISYMGPLDAPPLVDFLAHPGCLLRHKRAVCGVEPQV